MIGTFKLSWTIISRCNRRSISALILALVASGILDMISVASVLPFLTVAADPESIQENNILGKIYKWLNFSSTETFTVYLGIFVLVVLLTSLFFKVVTISKLAKFSNGQIHNIGIALLSGYLNKPYEWFLSNNSSDVGKTLLYEVDRVVGEAIVPTLRIASQAASIFFILGFLLWAEPVIAALSAVALGGSYIIVFLVVKSMLGRVGDKRAEMNGLRYRMTQETFGGIKEVKLLGLENLFLRNFEAPSKTLAELTGKFQFISEVPRHFLEVVSFGGMVVIVVFLTGRGDAGIQDAIPTLGLFAISALRLFPAIQQVYHSAASMKFVQPMLERISKQLNENTALELPHAIQACDEIAMTSSLELKNVFFRYKNSESPTIVDLSVIIPARSVCGIVGGTGAGKSTIADLILGLLEPHRGSLLIDGIAISAPVMDMWRRSVGYVPQQIFLTDRTIAENIAFGIPSKQIDRSSVERAARLANLHDFVINELPEGYDTEVGERGVRLSGGQRQRIGIARALYRDPDVLVFDEATSALDNLTERAVMEAVNNLGGKKTIIMIAHRLSTVRNCDKIFLMEKGRLVAEGTYDELVVTNETFRRMTQS